MASLAIGVGGALLGGALFGPIGVSLGFLAGSTIGNLLDPQQVQGPRLSDLKLQTSSYGAAIPIVYGTMRMAGNVIDETDLTPHEHTEGGKGGGPEVVTTTYSASCDIMICEGPIIAVRRIWADSRLIYDASPDATPVESVDFTLYLGDEDQLPDPTFEALHGVGNVPAYRGRAHIVFTDLNLAPYGGNRLPLFTFEVVAKGHTDGTIRRIWVNNDEDVEYGNTFVGPSTPRPMITRWTGIEDEASSDILVESLPTYYSVAINQPWGPNRWTYYGSWYSADRSRSIPIWLDPTLPHTGAQVSGLCRSEPIISGNPLSTRYQYAYCAPLLSAETTVPAGKYIANIAFSPDGRSLMLFTSDTDPSEGDPTVDHWYLLQDLSDVVVAEGDIAPALTWYDLGMPNWYHYEYQNSCNGLESNLKWLWVVQTALDIHQQVRLYHIGADGVLAFSSASGYGETDEPKTYNYPALKVVNGEGYAGVALGKTFALFCRWAVTDTLDALLADIVADVSERCGLSAGDIDVSELTDLVPGYVLANQMDGRAAIEPLRKVYIFDAVERDDQVVFVKRGGDPIVVVDADDLAAHEDGSEPPPLEQIVRGQEAELPRTVAVTYLNVDADYQTNTQPAKRMTGTSVQQVTVQLPIALRDAYAKRVAEVLLYQAWAERNRSTIYLPRAYLAYEPTDVITVRGRDLRVVAKTERPSGVIQIEGVPSGLPALVQGAVSGSAGGQTPPTITPTPYARLQLLDIPLQAGDAGFGYYTAVSSPDPFRGATVLESPDDSTYAAIVTVTNADTVGAASSRLLAFGGGNIIDEVNTVDVVLLRGSLSSISYAALMSGGNLAVLGEEILQFRDATLTDTLTYRLSGLLRGRFGTEWAMHSHAEGERLVLLPATFVPIDASQRGVALFHKAVAAGAAITSADPQQITVRDTCVRPLAPVGLGGGAVGSDVTLQWTRRARVNGTWQDGHDVPLDEAVEAYIVQIWDSTYRHCARIIATTSTTTTYTSAWQVADFGSNQQTVFFTVGQIGLLGLGTQAAGSAPGGGGSNTSVAAPVTPYGMTPATAGGCTRDVPVISDLSSVTTTKTIPTWLPEDEWVLQFTTGSSGGGLITIATPAGSRPQTRQAVLSTVQCGVPVGPGCEKEGTFIALRYYVTGNPAPANHPTLAASTTYYISVTTTAEGPAVATHTVI